MKSIFRFLHVCIKFFILFAIFICNVNCHTMEDAKRLLADKILGYDKNFRPLMNQSSPIKIYAGLELLSIREFDEVKEQLTITAYLKLIWTDEYMTWNPQDYGGLGELVIESDNVWTPNLVLVNNVDKLEKIGDAWQLIRFLPNGSAYFYPGNVFPASCQVDVTFYPWDRHKCTFTFAPWARYDSEVAITRINEKVMTSYFSENGAWTLYDSSSEDIPNSSLIDFSLHLQRKPRFVMVNVILPIIFMAFLNTMIYAIPVESGERISYSITVLLALAVFLTLVGDNLPKTSSPMSYFGYYLLSVLVISISITLTTIFNVHLYFKDEDDHIPSWIICLVSCLQCKCTKQSHKRKRITSEQKALYKKAKTGYRSGNHNFEKDNYNSHNISDSYYNGYREKFNVRRPVINGRVPYYISSCTSTVESDSTAKETKQYTRVRNSKVTWKDVSLAFDKIFFILSFVIIMIATIVFFVVISSSA